jgi:arsenite methyltransferase
VQGRTCGHPREGSDELEQRSRGGRDGPGTGLAIAGRELLDAIPHEALASFAGVGYHLDLAALQPGTRCSTWARIRHRRLMRRRAGGRVGRVIGVDFTDSQLSKAAQLRDRDGFSRAEFVEARIKELPFDDAVISNGVINLSVVKAKVFAEAARVLRPGGRLAIADIVSGRALHERTRRNVELWAACIAETIPRSSYLAALEELDLDVKEVRENDYRFISERALDACSSYEVESISVPTFKPL